MKVIIDDMAGTEFILANAGNTRVTFELNGDHPAQNRRITMTFGEGGDWLYIEGHESLVIRPYDENGFYAQLSER